MEDSEFNSKKSPNKVLGMLKKQPLLLLLLFLILTPLLITPYVHANDGAGYFSYVRSWFIDKDVNLINEKEHFEEFFPVNSIKVDPKTQIGFSQYPIGTALLWSPFYALAHIYASLSQEHLADGYSYPYVFMMSLASAVYGLFALWLMFIFLREFFSKKIALLSVVGFWLSSSLLWYMYIEASMSHAVSAFMVSAFIVYGWKTHQQRKAYQWIFLGAIGALMLMVHYQNAMIIPFAFFLDLKPLLSALIKKDFKNILNKVGNHAIFAVSLLIAFIPQFYVLIIQHGYALSARDHYQNVITPISALWNWVNVFFSANHGLFTWTPILLFCVIGLFLALRKKYGINTNLSFALLLIFLLQLGFISSIHSWSGAQAFGNRMFVNLSIVFVFGLALFLSRLEKRFGIWSSLLLLGFLVCWNFGLMIQYGLRLIPEQGPVPLQTIIKNNFFEVPKRLVSTLKQFIFSRGELIP